jgi:AraC-like DNA-binding protein
MLDELRMVGHWRLSRAEPNLLRPHVHTNAFEVCYIAEGDAEWWIEKNHYCVRRGQFFVTKPYDLHGGKPLSPSPRELYWFQISFPDGGGVSGLSAPEASEIREVLQSRESPIVDAGFDPLPAFERLLRSLREPVILRDAQIRTSLDELLIGIASSCVASRPIVVHAPISDEVARALAWMEEHLDDEFDTIELAAASGLTHRTLYRLFRKQLGVSPAVRLQRCRIARARQMLTTTDVSITGVALASGFATGQYFSKVFRDATGVTPRAYRKISREPDPGYDTPAYLD